MWSIVLFLTFKFSDQLWLLPWANNSLIELLSLHGSTILISNHFLDFRFTVPMDFSTCSLQFSPRTVHLTYSKQTHQCLLFLSSWILLWNRHSQRGQGPAESTAFSSAWTQHYEYASTEGPITVDSNHLARYLGLKFFQTCVAPMLTHRRNSTHLENWTNPLNHTQFMTQSSDSHNITKFSYTARKVLNFFHIKGHYPSSDSNETPNLNYNYLLSGQSRNQLPEQPF